MIKIDTHTHTYPPEMASRIITQLKDLFQSDSFAVQAYGDGTLADLITQYHHAHFDAVAPCPIATKPAHHTHILHTLQTLAPWQPLAQRNPNQPPQIIPIGSVHPADPDYQAHLDAQQAAGAKMVKLHPFFQGADLNSPSMINLLKHCQARQMPVLMHTGDDPGFPTQARSTPAMILDVIQACPELKLICAHCAAWRHPEATDLIGAPVYVDCAFQPIDEQDQTVAAFMRHHDQSRILFATDWPWQAPHAAYAWLTSLDLPADRLTAILGQNAQALLAL